MAAPSRMPDKSPEDDESVFERVIGRNGGYIGRSRRLAFIVVDCCIAVSLVAFIVALAWCPAQWVRSMYLEQMQQSKSLSLVAKWPRGKVVNEYKLAQAYNRHIADDGGQESLGEFVDPFDSDKTNPRTVSEKDGQYQSLLNEGDGIMGSIRIPKISVKLPIYHGTSDKVLEHGAGHLYGTSLPVGGPSTNAVFSGHSGLQSALLFTRLDEIKRGDIFYVRTLGRTMGYRVTGIHVIDPADTHLYKVVPGRDLVTLMTCTPYGVNTQRLIITGTRQSIPDPIPDPDDVKGDPVLTGMIVGFVVLLVGAAGVRLSHRRPRRIRHSAIEGRFGRRRPEGAGSRRHGIPGGSAQKRLNRSRDYLPSRGRGEFPKHGG
ncbi:class C sortase [Bifidobacterium sp. ESL0682]|uniref:class C sortase n=1 Tax=Bifidobacterium sp. ESL0682 TaxID=2983212 RepID=UPI0023F79AB2|nr:class C sortase [Bifidobacterium sp. ESL0682]WEV41913.1 class C sortase [Bifidobacterium sp. ESL0682]